MVDKCANLGLVQQRELEMLCAATNSRHNLVGLGSAQHKDHMRRRFLKCLQQGVLGPRGQHVHFVEDVDLGASRRPQGNLAYEVSHGVDTVVRCSIEFVQVIAAARAERLARVALVARFTTLEIGAVQRFGQDARRRGLASAARATKQIGVPDTVTLDRVDQGSFYVVLTKECVFESRRSVTPVQRLIGH